MKFINDVSCPVCGGKSTRLFLKTKDYFLTGEEFDLLQCTQCSFIFTHPVPSPDHLFSYYDSPEYASHELQKFSFFSAAYTLVRKLNIRYKFNIVHKYNSTGKILDVGCGTGELLKFFKDKGWYTSGIEPVKKAREYASKKHNLEVYDESQLNLFDDHSFDVITLWHVLEHVYNLNRRLEELKRILKPNGVFIIAVPNIESYDASYYGNFWASIDVPRHLYHFSRKTISLLLNNHSLKIVNEYPLKFDAFYVSLLSERFKQSKTPSLNAFLTGIKSNKKAASTGNYSSMIFAVQHI